MFLSRTVAATLTRMLRVAQPYSSLHRRRENQWQPHVRVGACDKEMVQQHVGCMRNALYGAFVWAAELKMCFICPHALLSHN